MSIKQTPYGAQWRCEKEVSRMRGGVLVKDTCNANGIASTREKAQRELGAHDRREH